MAVINSDSDVFKAFTRIKAHKANTKDLCKMLQASIHEKSAGKYDPSIEEHLLHMANACLSGYRQSWKYLLGCEKDIRGQFSLHREVIAASQSQLMKLLTQLNQISRDQFVPFNSSSTTFVGIHVRRGDMTSTKERVKGYVAAPLAYIEAAMSYYRERYMNNVVFVVVSDDMSWCRQHISQENRDVIFAGSHSHISDLATLISCNHSIITSGSFGWWAGWLTGGNVVYFSGFPTPGTIIGEAYSSVDYYPNHWIPLD